MRYSFLFLWVLLSGCASKPVVDMVLADVALKSAQKAKADTHATDYFRKAENHYLRAKRDYQDGYYDSSRKFAKRARILAEKAEYRALLKQAQIRTGKSDEKIDEY